jgi:hypothetical protein
MSISTLPLIRCSRGAGTSNCRSAARSTSARAKATINPARLFLRFATDRGEKRAMEVIWGNRLKPGEYKYIGDFPHFVADAGDDGVGRWLDERIGLARVYAEIWKDATPAHLVDIAVFCDSDDTHNASISYFDYVRLERRRGSGSLSQVMRAVRPGRD